MKKVLLDESKCIGCGTCFYTAQENFKCNDEGRASLISDKVTDEAIEASECCPVSAITIKCDCTDNCDCGDNCNCDDDCNCGCKNK